MTLPEVLNNLAIQNLLQQKAMVQAEYEQELQRRKEDFPTVKQARARLDELDRPIAAIASGIRQTLRSEEHTSELQSLMRIAYADFCLKKPTTSKYEYTLTNCTEHS